MLAQKMRVVPMHSCGNTAIDGCSRPNFWADLAPVPLQWHCDAPPAPRMGSSAGGMASRKASKLMRLGRGDDTAARRSCHARAPPLSLAAHGRSQNHTVVEHNHTRAKGAPFVDNHYIVCGDSPQYASTVDSPYAADRAA